MSRAQGRSWASPTGSSSRWLSPQFSKGCHVPSTCSELVCGALTSPSSRGPLLGAACLLMAPKRPLYTFVSWPV